MNETEAQAETLPSESPSASGRGKSPNSLRNLVPFVPGVSGNPSGLRKDGTSPKGRALEASLLEHLAKPGAMDQVARSWIKHAKRGSAQHLAMILDRLYPVPQDVDSKRVVLEGLRLELTPGGGASVTMARALGPGASSFAGTELPESREGGARIENLGAGAENVGAGAGDLEIQAVERAADKAGGAVLTPRGCMPSEASEGHEMAREAPRGVELEQEEGP